MSSIHRATLAAAESPARTVQTLRSLSSACLFTVVACGGSSAVVATEVPTFARPQRVVIEGYEGDAMEPFITRDGRYLLFNNLNEPAGNTNLHHAERIDDVTFRYRGEIDGFVEAPALSPDGRSLYYHRKDANRFIIYRVTRP